MNFVEGLKELENSTLNPRIAELAPTTVMELPVEALALIVLQDYVTTDSWNRRNWMLNAKQTLGDGDHLLALQEAFSWLEARCLLVRHPSHDSPDARSLSRLGKRALELGSLSEIIAAERLGLDLHPTLAGKVRPVFQLGDYETAAFKAMKEVEVRVRTLAGLPHAMIGVYLMRTAFHPDKGALSDLSAEGGERQARMELFAGAIGSFKNPTSHRTVEYTDAQEASEVILLADLLMRILNSVEERLAN